MAINRSIEPPGRCARQISHALVGLTIFIAVIAGLTVGAAGAQSAEGADRAAAVRIFELVNRDRGQAGLPDLSERTDLTAVAASWSVSMAQTEVLSHNAGYFSPASIERLKATSLSENVARNGGVDDAHARLMASPSHRANIMSTKFTAVGIAVFRDDRGTYWVTQNFLLPSAVAPGLPALIGIHPPVVAAAGANALVVLALIAAGRRLRVRRT